MAIAYKPLILVYDFFDEAELRLIESRCKRNEVIPNLVEKAERSLLPMRFLSAKEAPRTAPNEILIVSLAAGDGNGIPLTQKVGSRGNDFAV